MHGLSACGCQLCAPSMPGTLNPPPMLHSSLAASRSTWNCGDSAVPGMTPLSSMGPVAVQASISGWLRPYKLCTSACACNRNTCQEDNPDDVSLERWLRVVAKVLANLRASDNSMSSACWRPRRHQHRAPSSGSCLEDGNDDRAECEAQGNARAGLVLKHCCTC